MNTFIRILDALGPLWWPLAVTTILLVYRRTLQRWAERTELTEAGVAGAVFKFTGREVERIAEEVEEELEEAAVAAEKGVLEPGEVRERLHEIVERSNLDLYQVNVPWDSKTLLRALEREGNTDASKLHDVTQRVRHSLTARERAERRAAGVRARPPTGTDDD